ncbi:MAG: beta-propeller fold lactonase family protein [Gallionella sp.]|jgi:6-phosphogluconolactonase (cycloisomerase 2 family)|nr:beta-propeller fold lactonase family protein [Gallionella sp.]
MKTFLAKLLCRAFPLVVVFLAACGGGGGGAAPFTPLFAYVANNYSNNVSAYTLNATSGALTPVAGSPFAAGAQPNSVTVDPSGKFAYVANAGGNNVSAYTLNATSGALTPVVGSPFAAGGGPDSVAVGKPK